MGNFIRSWLRMKCEHEEKRHTFPILTFFFRGGGGTILFSLGSPIIGTYPFNTDILHMELITEPELISSS